MGSDFSKNETVVGQILQSEPSDTTDLRLPKKKAKRFGKNLKSNLQHESDG